MSRRILAHQQGHDGLLGMETVFCFVEDLLGMAFEDFFGDLFAPVSGQAMEISSTAGWEASR